MAREGVVDLYLTRLHSLTSRRGLDPERLLDELRDHIAEATDAFVLAGMDRDDAERAAIERLGDPADLASVLATSGGVSMRTAGVMIGAVAGIALALAHALPSGGISWGHPAAGVAVGALGLLTLAGGMALSDRRWLAVMALLGGVAGVTLFVLSPLVRPYNMYAASSLGSIPDIAKWAVFLPGVLLALILRSLKGMAVASIAAGYVALGLIAIDYPFAFIGSGRANSAIEYLVGGWTALALLHVLTRERLVGGARALGRVLGKTADRLEVSGAGQVDS